VIGLCVRSSYFSLCVCNGRFNIVLGCFIFKQLRRTFHHNIRVLLFSSSSIKHFIIILVGFCFSSCPHIGHGT